MQVRKSNGSIEEFDNQKIKDSICNAYEAVGEECDDLILQGITNSLYVYDNISTLEIRRQVEDALMSINKKVARAFSEKYSDMKDILKKQDFIKEYIASSNAATGSKFDANANVTNKNIVTMGQELYKENNIKQNRYILADKIRKMYSKKLANQYIKDLESHVLYKHDESGTPGYPYTYSAMETVEVKYNGVHLMVPFTMLWDILKEEEVLVNYEDEVWQKYPKDLYVKDKENTFIRITVMTKKYRKRSLVWVKTSAGEDVVVTDNHPMIVNSDDINDTVEAINSQGLKQFKINEKLEFGHKSVIDMMKCPYVTDTEERYCMTIAGNAVKRYIDLDEEMGYLVGCILGNKDVNVCWSGGWFAISSADRRQLSKLNGILFEKIGVVGKIEICRYNLSEYKLTVCDDAVWWLFVKEFGLGFSCRVLPYNFLEYGEDFAKGMVDGLMDTIARADSDSILLKHKSRPLILQTTAILRHFGFGVENEYMMAPGKFGNLEGYWGVRCYGKDSSSYKKDGETTIEIVRAFGEGDDFMSDNRFIYDITTESRTFDLNNILVHNCVAITMYPFLVDGLKGLGGESKAPTDLKSYCGEFINLVYSVSSQFMGACMHQDQTIIVRENGEETEYKSKDFVEKYLGETPFFFSNYQGIWEYQYLPEGLEVKENGKFVPLRKVYRRKYSDDIYTIKSEQGCVASVSKDHRFKFLKDGRTFEVKASELMVGDWVEVNIDNLDINFDTISEIATVPNDGKYVYEIETESHWYNCGGFITHNCATPEFLMYMDYFIRKDYGDNYLDRLDEVVEATSKKRTLTQVIDNCFQQVVHSMNMPAGNRGYQSVFWNVSYYDREYFNGVFSDFVFPDGTKPKWETLSWLQKHFMKWFNKEREKYILTFPVETMAMLTDGKDDFLDKEYADFTAEMWAEGHSFFCYLSDSPDSLSSCCFAKGQKARVKVDGEEKNETFETLYENYGCDKALLIYHNGRWEEGKMICLPNRPMFRVLLENGAEMTVSDNHLHPTQRGTIQTTDLKVGDSLKYYDDSKSELEFVRINSIEDSDYYEEIYCFEMSNKEDPYFTLANGVTTHNCRLRNSLKDLDNADEEHNHTTHQYSMGTASVATGSKSVMTMNLPRLIQNATRKYFKDEKGIELEPGKNLVELGLDKDYDKEVLFRYISNEVREMTERIHKYQTAFNETIKDFLEANMLDVYRAGFIDMRKQYLTVGVNGITDAAEFLGLKINVNDEYREFVENILETINISNRKDRTRECMFNTEFVPAENLAVKNYKWDKRDNYWVSPNRVLYSSYFYNPEDTTVTPLDKFKLHGKSFVEKCDGGQALHMNLQEHLSKEQYRQLLKVAAMEGCNYFTFNIRNTVCNDCGYISKHTLDTCPRCGSKNLDWLTRVIGYLKRISSFSKPRQDEADDRYYA